MLTDVVNLWESLKTEAAATGKDLQRLVRPEGEVEIILAKGEGSCSLIVKGNFDDDWEKKIRIPNCLSCSLSKDKGIRTVSLTLTNNNLEEIFVWFSQDMVNRLDSAAADDISNTLAEALEQWSEAFRVEPDKGMSREAQQGLFAELFFLEEVLMRELTQKAVMAWHSQQSIHDFQLEDVAWEVKSMGGRRAEVRISSEDQLDSVGLKELRLAVVKLRVSEEAGTSVEEISDRLAELLKDSFEHLSHLRVGLAKYGYINSLSIVNRYFFTARAISEYLVTDEFPKIVSADIPSAINNVKYSLSLSSLESHLAREIVEY